MGTNGYRRGTRRDRPLPIAWQNGGTLLGVLGISAFPTVVEASFALAVGLGLVLGLLFGLAVRALYR
jgi:hypothetical protein